MVNFTSMDDHKNPDGTLNWNSYRQAKVANGEDCMKCGKFIMFAKGHPEECYNCKAMKIEKTKEVSHEDQLRCPKCGHIYKLPDEWYLDCKSGAEEMRTCCPECDHDFEVIVATTYTFTSPAMLTEESEGTNDD